MTSNTLRKALAKNSAQADVDGLFSTRQVCDASAANLVNSASLSNGR
jgi:hypothetical protein